MNSPPSDTLLLDSCMPTPEIEYALLLVTIKLSRKPYDEIYGLLTPAHRHSKANK